MSGGVLARRATLVCLLVLLGTVPILGGLGTAGASDGSIATTTAGAGPSPPPALDSTADPTDTAANSTATATPTDTSNATDSGTATATRTNRSATATETETPAPTATTTPDPNETATPDPNATATPDQNESTPDDTGTPTPNETATPNGTDSSPSNDTTLPSPDPNGTLGRENGVWYNASLAIDREDGLSPAEIEAIVSRTMARVERLRELEFREQVSVRTEPRAGYLAERKARMVPDALRTFDNAKFEALFLVDESTDSIAIQERNAGESVLGYYDPRSEEVVLLTDGEGVAIDETTLAHELVHALQDQHFGLENFEASTRDRANGYAGLIEGDATLLERQYASRCETAWSCLSAETDADGSPANTGVYLVEYQPYSDGPTYVKDVYARGGWSAVNDRYADPPVSSAEVLDEDDPDLVEDVHLEDETTAEWHRVRPPDRPDYAELGEAAIATAFVYPLYASNGSVGLVRPTAFYNRSDGELSSVDPFDYDQPYSAGWAGDRLHVYRNDRNETGYVWRLVWESSAEAREFYRGYRQLLAYWGAREVSADTYRIFEGGFADAFHVSTSGRNVTIVNAPAVHDLDDVRRSVPTSATILGAPPVNTDEAYGETMTVPPDAVLESPTQPGFGPVAVVFGLALVVVLRSRR